MKKSKRKNRTFGKNVLVQRCHKFDPHTLEIMNRYTNHSDFLRLLVRKFNGEDEYLINKMLKEIEKPNEKENDL